MNDEQLSAPQGVEPTTAENQPQAEAQAAAEATNEAQAPDPETTKAETLLVADSDPLTIEEELLMLIANRDRERAPELDDDGKPNPAFWPWRDCDRILEQGTVVQLGGVDVRLMQEVPIMAMPFRDEAVFAEHLAHAGNPQSFALNLPLLRNRYNANGAVIGINENHPLNELDARIAKLQKEVAAQASAEEADRQAEESAAPAA